MTIEDLFVDFIKSFPLWLRYPVTALAFWPSALKTRLIYLIWPEYRALWSRVPGTLVVVGTVPLWASDVRKLHSEGVRTVVNLCREWENHKDLYALLGITTIYIPTVDFDPPSLADTLRGVEAIAAAVARGESTYVHCKAGRGRSVCVVLAYLILHNGLSPRGADALIRSGRPHISKKWDLPLFTEIQRIAAEEKTKSREQGGGQEGRGGCGNIEITKPGVPLAPLILVVSASISSTPAKTATVTPLAAADETDTVPLMMTALSKGTARKLSMSS